MLFLETVLLFLDLNIPHIIISSLTAEQYFSNLSYQRIHAFVIIMGGRIINFKKVLAPARIEPAPSDLGFRNATITPGCLIVIHIVLHALYVLPMSWKTNSLENGMRILVPYPARIEVGPRYIDNRGTPCHYIEVPTILK